MIKKNDDKNFMFIIFINLGYKKSCEHSLI